MPAPPPVAEIDPATLARRAYDGQDWPAAAPLFRSAIGRDGESLELHFKLAITTSHLAFIEETVREFQWVLAHAPGGSEEARIAREWLAGAGYGGGPATAGTDAGGRATADAAPPPPDERVGDSGVSGIVTWAEPGGEAEPKRRMQVHLIAVAGQPGVREQRFTVRTDQDGRYTFKQIPPGAYKVTNTVAGAVLWRLRVTLEPGKETTLNLNPGNSIRVLDDFAGGG
jgi:hypothetical protein